MTTKRHAELLRLTECAIMLALSCALSFTEIIKMPMGGGVTLLSMLPVMLISVKYGAKTGLPVAFVFSLFNLAQGFFGGNVFVYCEGAGAVITVILFDYVFPFTALGLCGLARRIKKNSVPVILAGVFLCVFLRFICHYITGVVIWGQWAEDMSAYIYSLLYNGGYMLPEAVLTCAGAGFLLAVPGVRGLLGQKKTDGGAKEETPPEATEK